LKESSGQQVQKHAAFAPASQKLLGFRLRSHKMGSPYFVNHARFAFKRFFYLLAFAKLKYLYCWGKSCVFSESTGLSLYILSVLLRRIPSKSNSGRLNLQGRFIHPKYPYNITNLLFIMEIRMLTYLFLFLTLKYSCAISCLSGNRKDTSAWKRDSQKKQEININYSPIDFFPSK